MVENSQKYDDLPMARVAGVVMPLRGGADILENPSFYENYLEPPPLFYILSHRLKILTDLLAPGYTADSSSCSRSTSDSFLALQA